jgi:general secretion pathway protein I
MRGSGARRPDERGFTLIEVLVALMIAVLATQALYGGIALALRSRHRTVAAEQAVSRAQSHLAAIVNPALLMGERSGDDGGGYRWRTEIALVGLSPAPEGVRPGPWQHGTGLYSVVVSMFWREAGIDHRFDLTSALLGPVRGNGP